MQACTTELYITSICHQIIIHECYLNDRVLTNINICFSPTGNLISANARVTITYTTVHLYTYVVLTGAFCSFT